MATSNMSPYQIALEYFTPIKSIAIIYNGIAWSKSVHGLIVIQLIEIEFKIPHNVRNITGIKKNLVSGNEFEKKQFILLFLHCFKRQTNFPLQISTNL